MSGMDEVGCLIDDLDTPALLVDLDALEGNIGRMAEFATRSAFDEVTHARTQSKAHDGDDGDDSEPGGPERLRRGGRVR